MESSDTSDSDYVLEEDLLVPGKYRRSLGGLKELIGDNEDEVDDDLEDTEGFTDGGYHFIYKKNLLSAFEAVHKANGNGCKRRLNVVEQEKHIKGFDGCIKLSCKTCGLAHKMYSSEASLGQPDTIVRT